VPLLDLTFLFEARGKLCRNVKSMALLLTVYLAPERGYLNCHLFRPRPAEPGETAVSLSAGTARGDAVGI
jgi:hypothetical protein